MHHEVLFRWCWMMLGASRAAWLGSPLVSVLSIMVLSGCILFPMDPAEAFDPIRSKVEVVNSCPVTMLVAIGDGIDLSRNEAELNEESVFVAPGESVRLESFDAEGLFYVLTRRGGGEWILTTVPYSPSTPSVSLEVAGAMCEVGP